MVSCHEVVCSMYVKKLPQMIQIFVVVQLISNIDKNSTLHGAERLLRCLVFPDFIFCLLRDFSYYILSDNVGAKEITELNLTSGSQL